MKDSPAHQPSTDRLETGDRAPSFIGITAKGALYASDTQAGRTVVMILARDLDTPGLIPLLAAFSGQAEAFAAVEADLVALINVNVEQVFEFSLQHPGAVTLVGSPNDFMDRAGFDGEGLDVLVLDRNLRVAARLTALDADIKVAAALDAATRLPTETPRDIYTPAPVLILPNLLERDLCQELVEMHLAGTSFDSPALRLGAQGQLKRDINSNLKRRRDFLLKRDHPMHVRLTDIIRQRCFPEVKRCFQATVSHTERFNIACYPSDGGHFHRHRDNRPDIVAHRRFALSINITASGEGYEGGYLRLPEFNLHHYRATTGGGVIFSVNLLHEITPVLRGNRYVLITHLFDDDGVAQHMAMEQILG
ncbi:MAG: 2OG-Fe(II) oxygenase [Alphaproteobacteria bacterium]|nr:2OG-Fe(II) oxygenase [Alphaproteobacteria bacterium]